MQIKLISALSLVLQVRVLRTRKWPIKEEVSHGSIGIGSITRFPLHKILGVPLATPSPCPDALSGMRHREKIYP